MRILARHSFVVAAVVCVAVCFCIAVYGQKPAADPDSDVPFIVGRYYDAETVYVQWETDPAIIKELIPPPLEPYGPPLVRVAVSRYPVVVWPERSDPQARGYMVGSISVNCQYQGEPGRLSLTLIEDDDLPVFTGREMLGLPKKVGQLHLQREGRRVHAWVARHGTRVFELTVDLEKDFPALPPESERRAPLTGQITPDSKYRWRGYSFKFLWRSGSLYFPRKDRFDFGPAMCQQGSIGGPGFSRAGVSARGKAEVKVKHSPVDSLWAKMEIKKLGPAGYSKGASFTMLNGRVMKGVEVDPAPFTYYARYFLDH